MSQPLADMLYDHCEHKGQYVRLDWDPDQLVKKTVALNQAPQEILNLLESAPWKVTAERDFVGSAHVNLQEMRAAKEVVKLAVAESLEPLRLVNGTDSRVVLCAVAKGRSSSTHLNDLLRSCIGSPIRIVIVVSLCLYFIGPLNGSTLWIPNRKPKFLSTFVMRY